MCRILSSVIMTTLAVLSLVSLATVVTASDYVVEKNSLRLILPTGLSEEYNDLLKFNAAFADFGQIPFDEVNARSSGSSIWMNDVAFCI